MNVDDDFSFAQFFLETLVLPSQFFVFGGERITFRFWSALLRKGTVDSVVAFAPPSGQRGRVDAFATQQFTDLAGTRSGIRLSKNLLL